MTLTWDLGNKHNGVGHHLFGGEPYITRTWKATLSRSVKRLVERGLIEKRWSSYIEERNNHRYFLKIVYLTPKGKRFCEVSLR